MTTEQTTKHTPGPWKVDDAFFPNGEDIQLAIYTEVLPKHLGTVCQVRNTPNEDIQFSHDEAEANANLIAAAPELLEALTQANLIIKDLMNEFGFGTDHEIGSLFYEAGKSLNTNEAVIGRALGK